MKDKDEKIDHVKEAGDLFLSGYNCAPSVFCAFRDVTGLDLETSLKLSSSFGGGMGRMREVCGSMSAAFMIVGLLYGYTSNTEIDAKGRHYALVQKIAAKFKGKHNTIICRELLAGLKADDSPVPSVRDAEYYKKRPCLRFIEDAAGIIDDIIKEKSGEKEIGT